MKHRRRRAAAALLVAIGVIHLYLAPEYLDEQTYVGVLFILTGLGAAVVAPVLWFRGGLLAWSIAALIAASTFIGFVLSRTTGLPGFHESDWEVVGIASLLVEALVLVLFVHRQRRSIAGAAAAVADYSTPGATPAGPRRRLEPVEPGR